MLTAAESYLVNQRKLSKNSSSATMDMSSSTTPEFSDDNSTFVDSLDPWADQWKYARAFVCFFIVGLGLFILSYIYHILKDRHHILQDNPTAKSPSPLNRLIALIRGVSYRRLGGTLPGLGLPSLGVCILILSCAIFTFTWTFTVRPYYRPTRADGSPPLALRAGLFAVGMTPFIYALSFKVNIITFLTGVPHEKLNALHRWGARIMFVLSVVHTVPFLYQPRKEDGWVELKFWFHDDFMNANGCMALGALTWLAFASWAPLRKLCYEFFVYSHIVAAVSFLGFMFWHCEDLLTSWYYLWAVVAIWISSLIFRFAQMNWYTTIPATLSVIPDAAIKISIPTTLVWSPGQHVFLRFPKLAPFENHPFSIASVPSLNTKDYEQNVLEFVVRPQTGFTKRLLSFVGTNPDAEAGVVIDGPYGGMPRVIESFNTVVLIAGGSGITAVIGFLLQLTRNMKREDAKVCTERIKIVWTVKNQESHEWFRQEIIDAIEGLPEGAVECRFHVTGNLTPRSSNPDIATDKEAGVATANPSDDAEDAVKGRPDYGTLLGEWVPGMGSRACVIVSGPTPLRNSVANIVAGLQGRVGGEGNTLQEIYLHTEVFDW